MRVRQKRTRGPTPATKTKKTVEKSEENGKEREVTELKLQQDHKTPAVRESASKAGLPSRARKKKKKSVKP